jgi:hypothetical protein
MPEAFPHPLQASLELALGGTALGSLVVPRLKLVGVGLEIPAQGVHRVRLELGELLASPFL